MTSARGLGRTAREGCAHHADLDPRGQDRGSGTPRSDVEIHGCVRGEAASSRITRKPEFPDVRPAWAYIYLSVSPPAVEHPRRSSTRTCREQYIHAGGCAKHHPQTDSAMGRGGGQSGNWRKRKRRRSRTRSVFRRCGRSWTARRGA
jgi:hypothetical protein